MFNHIPKVAVMIFAAGLFYGPDADSGTFEDLQASCEKNDLQSCYLVATSYQFGRKLGSTTVPQDDGIADQYFAKACRAVGDNQSIREFSCKKVGIRIEVSDLSNVKESDVEEAERIEENPINTTTSEPEKPKKGGSAETGSLEAQALRKTIEQVESGDQEALKFLSHALIAVNDRMYKIWLDEGLKSEFDRYLQLKWKIGKAIGQSSKEQSLALMNIFLKRYDETKDSGLAYNGYALDVIELGSSAGFSNERNLNDASEIEQYGQLAMAQATYRNAETTRGFGNAMVDAERLTSSTFEGVRSEAKGLYELARIARSGAPPPRDSAAGFASALAEGLINSWTTPTDPGVTLPADAMAAHIAVDLWLK